ncbi:MAG: glycosyltransferase [Bacteroidetes bacterium]|nr:glycosyltransferase [Bacteroidota bacterium]
MERYKNLIDKKLHIVFIAGTLGQGGAERQLYYILKSLKNAGIKLSLLTYTQGEYWEDIIRNELRIPIYFVGKESSRIKRLLDTYNKIKELKPDIIQSMHFYTNLYATLAGRFLGIKTVGAVRCALLDEIASNGKIMGNALFYVPEFIICNSLEAYNNAINKGKSKSKLAYLPNAVDTNLFKPSSAKNYSANTIKILAIGRLEKQKRYDKLFDILASTKSIKKIETTIIGKGRLMEELKMKAEKVSNLTNEIKLIGTVQNPELFYNNADIFVLTSDFEGTPNVVLEAMSSGIPVVSTKVGNLSFMLKDGEGAFLIDTNNTEGFSNALSNLINDEAILKAQSVKARSFAIDNFNSENLYNLLMNIYKNFKII